MRHFHKSHSFVTELLQPISLLSLSIAQVVFFLSHGSMFFFPALALALLGFLVDARRSKGDESTDTEW